VHVKFVSLDRTVSLAIDSPGMGFTVSIDRHDHVWTFNRDGKIVEGLVKVGGKHSLAARRPQECPGCSAFLVTNHRTGR